MIVKIDKLKNFGIYKNFVWSRLDKFKQENLIYGWNYSGKTTFSNLFQNLEFKDKDKCFSGSEFSITTEQNNINTNHCQDDLENFPYDVRVFNSSYIKRIFTFDLPDSEILPISFYLGDPSGELDKKIKILEEKKSQLENIRDNRYQKVVDEFNEYNKANGKFSAKAKEIRENYLDNKLDQNKLNKAVIQQITEKVKIDLSKNILSDTERNNAKSEAISENTYAAQNEDFSFSESLEILSKKVKHILEDTVPKSISFPELDEEKVLFDWVQKGIELHHGEANCQFCTNPLPENRITDLNTYYSKKLQEIQDALTSTQEKIKLEKEKLKVLLPDKKDLTPRFQTDFKTAKENFNETVKDYEAQLVVLEGDLTRKASSYFTIIPATKIELISLKEDFKLIEKSIQAHNTWLAEFDENKTKALKKILHHYIAKYLQVENYNKKESSKNHALTVLSTINSKISKNKADKLEFETQLKSTVKGQEELNTMLEILLHRNDIKIEIRNNKFTLERSGHTANNLSEGEKSAIAFAYFLTELKALRKEEPPKLFNTVIFIDDPISSLDSNHIFQVRSLLQNFFKKEVKDYLQLFISTHNFDFFSVMYDSGIFSKTQKEVNRPLYFIKRIKLNSSTIEKLPKMFSRHKSEYVGLFHILKEFHDLEDKEDFPHLLILPNALRRFLELYTLMKYPTELEVDKRVSAIFKPQDKPYHGIKLLHWFSHQNQFEKVQQHDDKILQIEDAIGDLLKHIKEKDKLHWKGLTE